MRTFQEIIRRLSEFWEKQGCIIHQGYDLEVGAGTFNPATFLRCLGPEPYKAAYVEPSRRPTDGRYGTNPNRVQHYFQYQVVLKPSPSDIQTVYMQSLEAVGFNLKEHDVRFVHDDWEAPTLGAWGLGWEVWMDGMEVTQITYFQSVGNQQLKPITGEITYGLERLAMYLQKVNTIFDIQWNEELTYGDIYQRNEVEWSHYNFEEASTEMWFRHFDDYEREAKKLMSQQLPIPAYDFVMKASHAFNLLDARGAISVTERTGYIGRIRDLACSIAESYVKSREQLQYPLLKRFQKLANKPLPPLEKLSPELLTLEEGKQEDFLLEIGSEELPATFIPTGCANLEKGMRQLFKDQGITYSDIKTYGTPRRLAIYVEGLALSKPPKSSEKKGPAVDQAYESDGNLKPAGEGFFRSINSEPVPLNKIRSGEAHSIEIRSIKGVDYLFASIMTPGQSTAIILSEQLPKLILNIDFPKKMRWADYEIAYARPIIWLTALLGTHVIPFVIADVPSGRLSSGHRQLAPGVFPLAKAQDYIPLLKKHQVSVDMEERKKEINDQLDALEKTLNAKIIERDRVIPQVLNLVEWPLLTYAEFDPSFLKAPKEILISEMVEHQKYFPVASEQGQLKNFFIIAANTQPTDEIRRGNCKVLSARLSDGVFLYEQDLKSSLEKFNEKLQQVTFQKELGSVFDKVKRLMHHVETLARYFNVDAAHAKRAAELCKADLASAVVYEFPELQGIIGKHYALLQGEHPDVAQAIDEHWMPRGENAPLPESTVGFLVSLADKIDNLIGCFGVNLKPTSSSDPYALRRQVLGIIKMLIQRKAYLPLMEIFKECCGHFPPFVKAQQEQILQEIEVFMTNRIKTVFQDYGFNRDEIEASVGHGFSDIYDTFCKVQALHLFRKSSTQFPLLFEVYKRAKGQLNNTQKQMFSAALLQENAEKQLDVLLNQVHPQFETSLHDHRYDHAYELIAQLQPALALLFDQVKILADDAQIRDNRIALLQRVFGLFSQLLDFSKIQGA